MNKNNFRSGISVAFILLFGLNISLVLLGIIFSNAMLTISGILVSIFQLWLHDLFASKASILKNVPFKPWLRDIFCFLPDKLLKRVISFSAYSLNEEQKKVISDRAKKTNLELIPNSLSMPFVGAYECVVLSQNPVEINNRDLFIEVGAANCQIPYRLSILSMGAFNQEPTAARSMLAIGKAAKRQNCALNTGLVGITSDLLRSGCDLIWRVKPTDLVSKDSGGRMNEAAFKRTAQSSYIRMVELQITLQHFPFNGNTISFHNTIFLLEKLKFLSGGKPIGISLNNPGEKILDCICKTMFFTGIHLDFMTIEDGNVQRDNFKAWHSDLAVGHSFSLVAARKAVDRYKLPTKIIASADLVTEYDLLKAVALGAHACFSIRPFLAASDCRTGVWGRSTTSRSLSVVNFHRNTMEATIKLMEACAYRTFADVKASDFYNRTTNLNLKTLEELYSLSGDAQGQTVFSNMN